VQVKLKPAPLVKFHINNQKQKMKKVLLFICLLPLSVFAQKTEPFKGAKKIIATYNLSGDSLYDSMLKALVKSDYTINKREKDLLYMTTEDRSIKQIKYDIKLQISDSIVIITGRCMAMITYQIGMMKSEPSYEDLKYTSKMYVTREVFDTVINFVRGTNPTRIIYE
jgi:hypothetical protein